MSNNNIRTPYWQQSPITALPPVSPDLAEFIGRSYSFQNFAFNVNF